MSAQEAVLREAAQIIKAYDAAMACQGEHAHVAKLIVMANYGDLAINILRSLSAAQPQGGGVREALERVVSLLVNDSDPPSLADIEGVDPADVIEVYELVSAALSTPQPPTHEPALPNGPGGCGAQAGGWMPTHRHVKRGTEYQFVGTAEVQAPNATCTCGALTDYEVVVVYRDASGNMWVRRKSEFYDGRFAALPSAPGELVAEQEGKS